MPIVDPATVDTATQTVQTMNWPGLIFLASIIIAGFGLIWLWLKKESKKEPEPVKIEMPFDKETFDDIQRKINQCRTSLEELKSEMLTVKATETRIEADIVRVSNHLRDLVDKMSYFAIK
jgi:hypothetical protein